MRWWTSPAPVAAFLSGVALAQSVPAPKMFELPPYRPAVTPAGSAPEGTPVRVRPVTTPNGPVPAPVCRLEVWAEAGGHGPVWAGAPDGSCAREDAINLPAGRYSVKLSIAWSAAAPGSTVRGQRHATAETPYEITSSVNKLQMTKCVFSPAQPMVGRSASLTWEVRSGASTPLGPFRVSVLVGHARVEDSTVSGLGSGATTSRTVAWTPPAAGTFQVVCAADPENAVHESGDRKDNSIYSRLTVVKAALPNPVVVLGKLHLGPTHWRQEYIVCNVDLDAHYRPELAGCAIPCSGGDPGVPSRDFRRDLFSADGALPPGCPAGLVSRAAHRPGDAIGNRHQYEDRTYTLKVTVSKDGASAGSGPISIRVPQHCGMLSIPICVETEGAKGR